MTDQAANINRIKFIIVETVFLAVVLLIFTRYWVVLGLLAGALISIVNFRLVSRATALNGLLKRYLLRMLIAGGVLVAAAFIETGLLLGALVGLTMEMQTYLWDAAKELWRMKPGR